MQHQKWLVLGAGSWGTALACQLARKELSVTLWGRDPDKMRKMADDGINESYLPNIALPQSIKMTSDLASAMQSADYVVYALPSKALPQMLDQLSEHWANQSGVLLACKGLLCSSDALLMPSDLVTKRLHVPSAIIAGPSFAQEVANDQPTAVVMASTDQAFLKDVVKAFHGGHFRVYQSDDPVGVQIAAALKNPLAVAAGIADGLGLGANSRSALLTRALSEMSRFGMAFGAKASTFMGLAGIGDLLLTGTSDLSRNRRLGLFLGQGYSVAEASNRIGQVIESLANIALIESQAEAKGIQMPIVKVVHAIMKEELSCDQAVQVLLEREQVQGE